MIDITTIQTYAALPELQTLNRENIYLKKENEGIKIIVTTIICLSLGIGLYVIINKHNEEYR